MRQINRIFWHCTATPEGRDVTAEQIRRDHKTKWSDIGYHYVIRLDGAIEKGRPDEVAGAHVAGHNHDSLGIAYVGGVAHDGKTPKDTRNPAQRQALYALTERLLREHPGATVHGHNEHAAKACPSFDAQADWAAWLASQPPAPADWRAAIEARLAALEALFPMDTKG